MNQDEEILKFFKNQNQLSNTKAYLKLVFV